MIGALELACHNRLDQAPTIIPPSEMATSLYALLASGAINADIARTLGLSSVVIVVSIVLGFALGLVIHALPRLREALDPLFATYYAVPIFIFYPVLIAIFGLSPIPIVLIGVATAIVAMIIATLNGLDRVPRVLTKVARVHRLGAVTTAMTLQLPAAAPYLFTGVKLRCLTALSPSSPPIHSVARRAWPRHCRRLFRFQQSAHVCADPVSADHRDRRSTRSCMCSTCAGRSGAAEAGRDRDPPRHRHAHHRRCRAGGLEDLARGRRIDGASRADGDDHI